MNYFNFSTQRTVPRLKTFKMHRQTLTWYGFYAMHFLVFVMISFPPRFITSLIVAS